MIKVDGITLFIAGAVLFLFSVITLGLFIADIMSYRKFIKDNPELTNEEEKSKVLNLWKMIVGILLWIIVVLSSAYLISGVTAKTLFEFEKMSGKIRGALRRGELDRSVKEQILGWIAEAEKQGCYIEEEK